MKKLKKFGIILFLSLTTIVTVAAASGTIWYAGNTIKLSWYTDYNTSGDYIDATMTGYGSTKCVYARMGENGTYSKVVESSELSVQVRDYGPFGSIGKGDYEAWGEVN